MSSQETFLRIVRLGIRHSAGHITGEINWDNIQALAEQQGLSAIIVDGVERLPEEQRPSKELLLQWIGTLLQEFEYRYEMYHHTIAEMARFYNQHGYKMMVLKGYACSLNWPKPEHRPCGDIDIWLFGKCQEADALLSQEKGIRVDKSHHHHTVFDWRDFMVENHYDFINVHHHKSSAKLEQIFKELGKDDTHSVKVCGEKVYLPSPNLHTLFLLKHSLSDFAAFNMTLRQVLDWGFHVKQHYEEIDWNWLTGVMSDFHMEEFFNVINAICIDDLGFDFKIFPYLQYTPSLKNKVLNDILYPKFTALEPPSLVPRLVYKYRRWKGNAWKQELCYSESRWSAFWSGVWGHLLKPKSI